MRVSGRRDAGRVVTMVPLASLAALIAVGIGVDFSGQVRAEQALRDTASQCARVGAGQIGVGGRPGTGHSETDAQACLHYVGQPGVAVASGGSLLVTIRGTYTTTILGIIGIQQLPLKAEASATILEGQ